MSLMENLTKLFRVDTQVRALRSRVESAQRYFDHQRRQCEEVAGRRDELLSRKRHLLAHIANMETEAAAKDEQLEKFRGDMNSASTNKQYTAVLTELNTVKAERSKIDDQMLSEMEKAEQLDSEIAEVDAQLAEREKVREVARAQLAERKDDVGTRLEELERERTEAAADVPASDLEIFDHMADMYDGEAMAAVVEVSRRHREYACDACNMHLPFEQVSNLMSSVSSVVRCPACMRILFMQDEMKEALTPK